MDDVIKRSLLRLFPELSGGYHLPRFGRVVAIPDAPAAAGLCNDLRPGYGVDIEVLGEDGEADPALPILAGVPLPLPSGGEEMGMFAFPQEGTRVVVCFAYGSPSHPYIQSILPHGLGLHKVTSCGNTATACSSALTRTATGYARLTARSGTRRSPGKSRPWATASSTRATPRT